VRDEGMPPTHEEIRRKFGLQSTYGVRQHLRLIKNKGYIELLPGKSRGIRVLGPVVEDAPQGIADIPIVGRIAAGQPILAEEHLEGRIAVSAELFPPGVLFALRVKGESMVNVGIQTGDLAVIRQQAGVENGQIGAVLRDDEATLKRVYVFADHLRLKAENDSEPDIRIAKGAGVRVDVLGLYVGLIRQAR
jgi:repressor LexA